MIDGLLDLASHQRERLARALEAGLLGAPYSGASLRSVMGEESPQALATLRGADQMGVSAPALAAFIRTLEKAAAGAPRPDLVWSGPEVPGLHARDTRRVFDELIGSAHHSICASTYAFFDGPRAFKSLAKRVDEQAGVRVTLLLNIPRKRGDTTTADQLVRRFARRFWATDWPGTRRPDVYYDPRALDEEGPGGVLHAKAVVIDEEVAFVTSANLTEAALDRNIELGLLARDRGLAASISLHFRTLIDRGLLRPLPDR